MRAALASLLVRYPGTRIGACYEDRYPLQSLHGRLAGRFHGRLLVLGQHEPPQKSTVGGAALGGVAGAVITNGGILGTVGGAAIGGVIGDQVGK